MCGIAGIHIKPKAKGTLYVGNIIDQLLLGIEARGKDATGFMSVSFDNQIQVDKAAEPAKRFINTRKSLKGNTRTVMLHTRLATQGHQSKNENNHPVQYGTMFVTHNGIIWNDRDVFENGGFDRTAEVDTQAIAAALWEECGDSGFDNAGKALETLEGAMACAAMDVKNPGVLLLARGYSSPLVMIENDKFIMWASTIGAIKNAWGKSLGTPPADNKFIHVKEGELFIIEDGKMTKQTFEHKAPVYASTYGGWGLGYAGWDDPDDYDSDGRRGYWHKSDDGSRTYKELGGKKMAPITPFKRDLEVAATYTDWADTDLAIHREAIEVLASNLDLETNMVEWLLFYAQDDVINSSTELAIVYEYAMNSYQVTYDDLMRDYTGTVTSTAVTVKDDEIKLYECVDCGTPNRNIYRCDICYKENGGIPFENGSRRLDNEMLASMARDSR